MRQLTLRGFEPELERCLRALAARDQISLNKAALKLMRRGAGLESASASQPPIGDRIRQFGGYLAAEDKRAIDQAISDARQQDVDLQH
jgi:hypothetical protein